VERAHHESRRHHEAGRQRELCDDQTRQKAAEPSGLTPRGRMASSGQGCSRLPHGWREPTHDGGQADEPGPEQTRDRIE
jgi:hypothetical protein